MLYFCYIPTPNLETARTIADKAISESLAACGNILPQMTSVYSWEGKIETANESLLILKTVEEHQEPLRALVEELHPYDVPCITFFCSENVNAAYMQWVNSHVRTI